MLYLDSGGYIAGWAGLWKDSSANQALQYNYTLTSPTVREFHPVTRIIGGRIRSA